ncbi:MAG: hypothetical protein RL624_1527 [Bacteroidota bacterium]|jgi:Zn-dependent M28 family amino/carboxypeptidase
MKNFVFILVFLIGHINVFSQKSIFKNHIKYLSTDSLEGRFVQSKGADLAVSYIANYFQKLGLEFLHSNSYEQIFSYTYKPNPHEVNIAKDSVVLTGKNIVGFLNNNAKNTIVVGAHYDHIGKNEHSNSSQPNATGMIHNGADDNASGVAMVMELANYFKNNEIIEKSNYIFICFSGEEDGIKGSNHFVENFNFIQNPISAMINFDMIGRLDTNNTLQIGGAGTSPNFVDLIKNSNTNLQYKIDSSGIGPSDHTSFYLKNIPVLFYSTGSHSDYHKPTDDEEKINYVGLEKIFNHSKNLIELISKMDTIPFVKTKRCNYPNSLTYKEKASHLRVASFLRPLFDVRCKILRCLGMKLLGN